MKSRPLLFSSPMVRALLDGTKTQTRRVVKPQPVTGVSLPEASLRAARPMLRVKYAYMGNDQGVEINLKPFAFPGQQIWARETFWAFGRWETRFSEKKGRDEWHFVDLTPDTQKGYRFDAPATEPRLQSLLPRWWKRPAIFMPRAASRITLEIVSVRVERLQDISEDDAIAEGCVREFLPDGSGYGAGLIEARENYKTLWESINGPGSWDANPWVWVIEFKRI